MARKKTRRTIQQAPGRSSPWRWLVVGIVALAGVGLLAVALLGASDGPAQGTPRGAPRHTRRALPELS